MPKEDLLERWLPPLRTPLSCSHGRVGRGFYSELGEKALFLDLFVEWKHCKVLCVKGIGRNQEEFGQDNRMEEK